MSSTNRGGQREVSDYYVTPPDAVESFLMEFFSDHPEHDFSGKVILDPCAGGDSEHGMSYPDAIKKWKYEQPVEISTMDIRGDSLAYLKADYLSTSIDYHPDIIITNPPFVLAQKIIEKAMQDVKEGGLVIMLLRLNFFGSQGRVRFWDGNMPAYTYVHAKRMSFTDNKKTDSIEYMHCVWIKGQKNRFTQLRVI
jgi:hypothetical protein